MSGDPSPFLQVPNSKHMYAADPFIIERHGILYIFAELMIRGQQTWNIGVCEYSQGEFSDWRVVIAGSHHMAYPLIYSQGKNLLMIPDSCHNKTIDVYRCVSFPDSWVHEETLLKGAEYADTTPFGEDRYLSYRIDSQTPLLELLVRDDGRGNLVALDSIADKDLNLRPGGAVFEENGYIIRPCQVCLPEYGSSLMFRTVDEDDADRLPCERDLMAFAPKDVAVNVKRKQYTGLHTYNRSENYEVIDMKYRKIIPLSIARRFFSRIFSKRG